ncbi:hypothetical protein [Nocardia brasiliensis]|uniref:hypothetical protein n=1 Tax=Nocardia brasiliensis TaxID=37326 RepID=UPI0024563121|nr:hypothetical protein [Nocardia brasiliensis]
MNRSSQGIACPSDGSTTKPRSRRRGIASSYTAPGATAGRQRKRPSRPRSGPRARIRFSDADLLRSRVQQAAAALKLRGARKHVLAAALELLCGWSRLSDDQVRIQQLIRLCEIAHDPKTVGRALASLHRDELITYTPARGRGACATLAIHPRFLDEITELDRDECGRVITFSGAAPISLSKKNPQTPNRLRDSDGRPIGVVINPADLARVLSHTPEIYRDLPRLLRGRLRAEVRRCLARGFRPEQVLAILAAPMPDQVKAPFKLAQYRLRHNMIGEGPRLRPLQRAWDRAHRAALTAHDDSLRERRAGELFEATTASHRQRMLHTLMTVLPGQPFADEARALVHAARMACREFPGHGLRAAIQRWLHAHPATPPPPSAATTATDACLFCRGHDATVRHELPIPTAVCDPCWTAEIDHPLPEEVLTR